MLRVPSVALVAAVALSGAGACGGRQAGGPAWPASAGSMVPDDPAEDGGESLEPDAPAAVAALETAEEPEIEVTEQVAEAAVDEPVAEETPAAAEETPAETPPDEIFVEEEIVIEIE
jgi:hypothetical protein